MWEAIRANKRRSTVLLTLMGIILIALGGVIGALVEPQTGVLFGAVIAFGIFLILMLVAFSSGDKIILNSASARKIEKKDCPMLWNVVEEMTIASGLGQMPDVYIIENSAPNAFAVGRKPEKAAVAITTGLLKKLDRDELQGVIAHEIGHIKNLDVRFMTIAAVMMGTIILISDIFLRSLWFGGHAYRGRSRSSKNGGQAQLILIIVAIVFAILAPIVAQMLYFACSRKREYLADASGALYTRYPEGLASALEVISGRAKRMKNVSKALAPMYIINPLQGRSFASLFSTHPPTEQRIQILRNMSGAGFAAYEAAFKKVNGEKSSCIGQRSLQEAEDVGIEKREGKPKEKAEYKKQTKDRLQEVNDLLGVMGNFIFISCACGLRLKVPPDYKKNEVKCPRCNRKHEVIPTGEKKEEQS